MLPPPLQDTLSDYIWRVRSDSSLHHHTIRFPSGHEVDSVIDAKGWCVPDISANTVYICLASELETADEAEAIAVILHELAHAVAYSEDEDWWTDVREDALDEIAAWSQVANWAARNVSKPSNGGYKRADEVLSCGLNGALIEWQKWSGIKILPELVSKNDALNRLAQMVIDGLSGNTVDEKLPTPSPSIGSK